MKKVLIIVILVTASIAAFFLFSGKEKKKPELVIEEKKIELIEKAESIPKVKKKKEVEIVESSNKTSPIKDKPAKFDEPSQNPFAKFNESRLSDDEIDALEEYFEKVEADWDREVESLLIGELALPPQIVQDYERLREAYDQEKIEAFQEFHEFMEEKYGEGYSFTPNQDMEAFENKVLDVYQGRLRQLLGDEGYARYVEVREAYNNKIKAEQDPEKGVMLIEY